jgi:hypothetical protein
MRRVARKQRIPAPAKRGDFAWRALVADAGAAVETVELPALQAIERAGRAGLGGFEHRNGARHLRLVTAAGEAQIRETQIG